MHEASLLREANADSAHSYVAQVVPRSDLHLHFFQFVQPQELSQSTVAPSIRYTFHLELHTIL